MTQTSFLDPPPPRPAQQLVAAQVTEQRRELSRVTQKIGPAIMEWWSGRTGTFRYEDLVAGVTRIRGCPTRDASIERILRILRQEGHLNYRATKVDYVYEILGGTR